MSEFNTDNKRDEIRRQQNKPWYVKCPWFEKEFVKALDEIDIKDAEARGLQHDLKECKKTGREYIALTDPVLDRLPELDQQLKECRKEVLDCKKIVIGLDEGSIKMPAIEKRTKDAVRDNILEHCEPKTEYGPHGQHIEWYTADDIEQAIDSAGGEVDKISV